MFHQTNVGITGNILPADNIVFWLAQPDELYGLKSNLSIPGNNPFILSCSGFGNTHLCGTTGLELSLIKYCPLCAPMDLVVAR